MSIQITGDLLALDRKVRHAIQRHAEALQARFPNQNIELLARVSEEFDQINGHRVRCELLAERQRIVVRAARKGAEEAIDEAFDGIKKQFRQMSLRASLRQRGEAVVATAGMA